jgi:3-hydroxybutyryl-CoA dehydrogenase
MYVVQILSFFKNYPTNVCFLTRAESQILLVLNNQINRMAEIKTIAIAGAGTMGAGIAQVFAQAGFKVTLFDINEQTLDKAKSLIITQLEAAVSKGKVSEIEKNNALAKLTFSTNASDLVADLIIEAIVEKIDIKKTLFRQLAEQNSTTTILASNTSSLPITQLASGIAHPNRIIGLHFFNPAHLMKLVEIIAGAETDEARLFRPLKSLVIEKIGKTPVVCKDSAGFIVNRVARHYYVESLKVAEENIAPIETIDKLMESAGFKMGPFKLMDTIGNDINFAVTSSLFDSFHQDAKFQTHHAIQQQKVDAGHLGKKTGKGFYNYN